MPSAWQVRVAVVAAGAAAHRRVHMVVVAALALLHKPIKRKAQPKPGQLVKLLQRGASARVHQLACLARERGWRDARCALLPKADAGQAAQPQRARLRRPIEAEHAPRPARRCTHDAGCGRGRTGDGARFGTGTGTGTGTGPGTFAAPAQAIPKVIVQQQRRVCTKRRVDPKEQRRERVTPRFRPQRRRAEQGDGEGAGPHALELL